MELLCEEPNIDPRLNPRRVICHECMSFVKIGVLVGQDQSYDGNSATICESCLTAALKLLRSNSGVESDV